MPRPRPIFAPLVQVGLCGWLLCGAAACVGTIGDSNGKGGASAPDDRGPTGDGTPSGPGKPNPAGGNNPPGVGAPPSPGAGPIAPGVPADPLAAGQSPVRRLTAAEYNHTVRDLLGDTTGPAKDFPSDRDAALGFHRAGVISTLESERLRDAAEGLASAAAKNLANLLPCKPASAADESKCARQFAEEFGLRAYRRPLDTAEVDRLLGLYTTGRTSLMLPFNDGIALMLEAMLQSSAFLYRWELGPQEKPTREGDVVKLGPYQIASRLSYFLWSTMPDQELFDAARAGKLGTAEEIDAQARRMLKSEKARDGVGQFFEEWLGLGELEDRSKDPMLYPEFTDALKTAMMGETRSFVSEVMFNGDGTLGTLLGASFSMVDGALAKVYGASAPSGTGMQKVMLDPKQRAGLLTQGSFLALTGSPQGSNPIVRGKDIYFKLLCKEIPPPPPDVSPAKPASAGGTTRQRAEEHSRNECAAGCHQLFEPFGYAFEHYDGIGRYREQDNNLPVDASGMVELDGSKKSFAGARDLSRLIAESKEARTCFTAQWLRFAFRRAETMDDAASIYAALDDFTKSSADVRELLVGLAKSRTFRYRSPNPGEVLP